MAGDENVLGRDRDLAPIGALVGHPVRAAMLAVLADGQALPAGELARHARIAPATATAHLRRLVDGGLVRVHAQGRHRYHELAGPEVAAALEALAQIAHRSRFGRCARTAPSGGSSRRGPVTTTSPAVSASSFATGCSPTTRYSATAPETTS